MGEPAISSIDDLKTEPAPADKAANERSTIAFPYDDLNTAIEVAQAVHANGGRCTNDQLAARLKYSSIDNGAFRTRVATARHFSLITVSREAIAITKLGREIVDPITNARARVAAFLSVPLYKRTFEDHRGHTLPPAAGLELKFVEYGVAYKQKDKARLAFQRSAEQAGFFSLGRERLVEPVTSASPEGGQESGGTGEAEQRTPNNGGSGGGTGGDKPMHPFIRGLVETLPPTGTPWSDAEREEWLTAARSIFALIYKPSRIALPSPQSQNT